MREIPREQVLNRLRAENSWWPEPHRVPSHIEAMKPRAYLDLLVPLVTATSVRRAVLLLGPRRVGKTILVHHAVQRLLNAGVEPRRILYVSIDHPIYNGLGLDDLLECWSEAVGSDRPSEGGFAFFDEIQYLRAWEQHLKSLVDSNPRLRVVASGSAAAALRLKSTESGAGRFTDFLLPPLTFHEYLELLGPITVEVDVIPRPPWVELREPKIEVLNDHFLQYLNIGGYPEAILSPAIQADPARFIKSDIVDKVLLRDLPSLYGIQDIQELNALFTTLAFNTAQEVSLEELSKSSGVAKNTIKRYIEYLEAAFLIRTIHRVDQTGRRFVRARSFKVYLTNPCIRSALFAPVGAEDEEMGSLAETAVFAQWFHDPLRLRHFARWDKGEVDLVMVGSDQRIRGAIEVKWSDRILEHVEEVRGLLDFARAHELKEVGVTTRTLTAVKDVRGVTISFLPSSVYCYLAGRTAVDPRVSAGIVGMDLGPTAASRGRPAGPRG